MNYYLGIDAGGTKTLVVIADESGRVHGVGRSGSGNWESVGLDGAYAAYEAGLAEALQAAGIQREQLRAAGYALAGIDWPSDYARLTPVIDRLRVAGPYALENDTMAALRAGSSNGSGVVVIAGTGSTVAGRNQHGERFRTFGLGRLWGDFQGASGLVWEALRVLALRHYGRITTTSLEARLLDACGASSVVELAERISRDELPLPHGELAPLVFAEAEAGDEMAQQIIREAGAEMGANAAAMVRRLAMQRDRFELVMAGGVFNSGNALLVEALVTPVQAIAPQARPVVLQVPPAIGSVLLAFDAADVPVDEQVRARLAADVQPWVA
ncbi:MAG TPA: BadF/BadG/BcrA/BcrD ATPase family protein [Roseiflexaceae bacterium]|nr:BadF/BadG/BcrA/BcrD ATPase family protein [Roseiflexaceae bacterium]HMP40506.1 BadF/BadG/BcrA/BcrD ATPase family protein [Roseiflexaceae bacterium]